jgi:hypothetical protein
VDGRSGDHIGDPARSQGLVEVAPKSGMIENFPLLVIHGSNKGEEVASLDTTEPPYVSPSPLEHFVPLPDG